PRLEHVHRRGAVLVLAAVVLARDHDPGRNVGDAHRGIGRVDVLAAGARGAVGVDPQIAVVDLDVDAVVDHRIDPHRAEAGVSPRRAVVRADPRQPVHAAFGLGVAVGVLALDQQSRRLDPGLLAGAVLDALDLVALALGPASVHPEQHLGPVLAFGTACAGVN